MSDVVMPRLDPGMQSGKIVEWLKKEGDMVRKGEPILVVEGEKTTFEVEAAESGVLTKILAAPGDDVEVSRTIAVIGEASESSGGTSRVQSAATTRSSQSTSSVHVERAEVLKGERVVASPAARRLAQEHGVDLTKLKGTGPGGRISREDVLAAAQHPTSTQPQASAVGRAVQPAPLKKVKLEGVRKVVAERLGFSARTAVPVILTMEADASKLVEMKTRDVHVGFTAFAVKAAAKALERNSVMNATIDGEEITTYSDVNVAVAINTEQGLVAPVIRNASKKSLLEINSEIEQLSRKAKENRLTIDELTGGTFTITNLGGFDVESFAPVINPPQCAIIGLGRVGYKTYAVGERVSARPATLLTLVFDHRIVDGVPAAKFLRDVRSNLEDPESL
jgi:pyruvate dehydrogenase E2 component (dihydrolipoamide acetyltransferase)